MLQSAIKTRLIFLSVRHLASKLSSSRHKLRNFKVYIHVCISATGLLYSWEELCIYMHVEASNSPLECWKHTNSQITPTFSNRKWTISIGCFLKTFTLSEEYRKHETLNHKDYHVIYIYILWIEPFLLKIIQLAIWKLEPLPFFFFLFFSCKVLNFHFKSALLDWPL